jgi:hypothetical protein
VAESLERTAAELSSIADSVARSRERVGGLAEPFRGGERDDVVVAIEHYAPFVENYRIRGPTRKSGDDPSEGAVARRGQEAGPDARSKQVAGT